MHTVGSYAVAGLVRASGCGAAVACFGRLLAARIRKALPASGCRFGPSRSLVLLTPQLCNNALRQEEACYHP